MSKLEKLTEEQLELIPKFRDEAINFALKSGDELNVEEFKKGITFVYSLAKLKDPIKIYVDSPMGLQYACALLKKLDLKQFKNSAQVGAQVGAQVWAQVRDQVWAQVGAQVGDQVGAQVWAQVRDQVRDQVGAQVKNPETFADMGTGADMGWMTFYNYFKKLGLVKHEGWESYHKWLLSGVWDTILFNNFAIGCRRPQQVFRDDQNRMHNDQGSAIKWRDGYELYYLDGVHFLKDLFEKVVSKKMTFGEIMKIEISDQRTVALKYNPEAIINSGAELVDKSKRGNELYKIENQEINKFLEFPKIWFLKMKCPTGRIFIEGVDPQLAEISPDADVCQASMCGLTYDQYQLLKQEA